MGIGVGYWWKITEEWKLEENVYGEKREGKNGEKRGGGRWLDFIIIPPSIHLLPLIFPMARTSYSARALINYT
jgi:hypothetical protein